MRSGDDGVCGEGETQGAGNISVWRFLRRDKFGESKLIGNGRRRFVRT